jgi:uncharacterized protein YdeI (YjbR/CyaY-like superfamily)
VSGRPGLEDVRFFENAGALRDWFDEHHATDDLLWVGIYKRGFGGPSVTYAEAVDEALCVGWIDSVSYALDEGRRAQRFTPRRKRSIWSAVNVKRVGELIEAGRMRPAGLAAFEARDPERTAIYSHEQAHVALDDASMARFRAEPGALEFFEAQSPSYKRAALYWVLSARKPETRERRLSTLIEDSAARRRIKQFA